ncbi:MAG: hypothetical protein HY865_24915 [Chloroflexi bacterium]|nr:hypothetical protein [Chloroflexota bacterium]
MEENTRINGLQAFLKGLSRFARYPQLLFSAYVFNLLSALLLLLIPAFFLLKPAQYTTIQTAADGIDTWLVTELMLSTTTYPALQGLSETLPPDWLGQSMLVIVSTLLAIPLLSWLPSSFLAGGTLLTYVEAPQKFSWRRFLWGCWHWFGTFLLINMLLGIVTQVLVILLLIGIGFAFSSTGGWSNWITIPIFVLVMIPWLAILEYTRLLAVSNNTRNTFQTLWKAIGLVFRRSLALMGLYALSLLTLLLIHIIFRLLLLSEFISWGPLYLIVSQIFIAARLSTRLVRWAGAVGIH